MSRGEAWAAGALVGVLLAGLTVSGCATVENVAGVVKRWTCKEHVLVMVDGQMVCTKCGQKFSK